MSIFERVDLAHRNLASETEALSDEMRARVEAVDDVLADWEFTFEGQRVVDDARRLLADLKRELSQ
mgnify:FL=1